MPEQQGEDPLTVGIEQDLTVLEEKVYNCRAVIRRQKEEIARLKDLVLGNEQTHRELQRKIDDAEARERATSAVLSQRQRELAMLRTRSWMQPVCNLVGHRWNNQQVCALCKTPRTLALPNEHSFTNNRIPG